MGQTSEGVRQAFKSDFLRGKGYCTWQLNGKQLLVGKVSGTAIA